MKKPKPHTWSYLMYNEVIDYIEKKYKIKVSDYHGFSFWYWLIDRWDCSVLDTVQSIPLPPFDEWTEPAPDWVLEILKMIEDEFKKYVKEYSPTDRYLKVYISW